MELLLESIINETATKAKPVNDNARSALEFLESYSRAPASDYRKKVLSVVTASLVIGNTKLGQQAVVIIHKLGKDDRFHSQDLEEEQSSWMTQQVVDALSPLKNAVSELQTEYLQALLTLSYHSCWIVSGQICLELLFLCHDILTLTINATTRAAAQNVAVNTVSCLSRWLCRNDTDRGMVDVIPVMQFLCNKLEELFTNHTANKKNNMEKEMFLGCLEASIRSLNKRVTKCSTFCTFVWRSLCPAVIKLLVRGSGHSIVCSLTSLIGHMESHRPVLEATYHKMLVQTPTERRLDGLKAISRLLDERNGLLNICWIEDPGFKTDEKGTPYNDMAIIIMLLESLDQCASLKCNIIFHEVTSCVIKICEKLHTWCSGKDIDEVEDNINKMYLTLESCDYLGPIKYTTEEDIPEELKFIIEESFKDDFDLSSTANESLHQIGVCYDTSEDSDDSILATPTPSENEKMIESIPDDTKLWVNKVPKTLYSPHRITTENDKKMIEIETNSAFTYHRLLKNRMFRLNSIRSAIEIDQKLQEFSTQFCQDFSLQSPKLKDKKEGTIMNADGIYFTTYRVVHLNIKLRKEGHYILRKEDRFPSMTEKEFIDSILETGILIYLSATWLAQVYQIVLQYDLFEGCQVASPLVNLCTDVDGFGTIDEYGQLLVEYKRRHDNVPDTSMSDNCSAGKKYSRRILSAIWDYIMSITTKVFSYCESQEVASKFGVLIGSKNSKLSKISLKDLQENNIKILSLLLQLSRKVGFQNLTGSIFCTLSNFVCKKPENKQKQIRIDSKILLTLETILENGLELASHSQDCWKHIFKCCQFISNFEEYVLKLSRMSLPRIEKTSTSKIRSLEPNFDSKYQKQEIWLGFVAKPEKNHYVNLNQIFKEYNICTQKTDVLTGEVLIKCISLLSCGMERLFADASSHLNLMSLLGYLRELCFQSHKELILLNGKNVNLKSSCGTYYISQLSDAMLRCIRAGRPLLHLMLAWSIAGPHFMEASSHSDPTVSKLSIQAIHDVITSLLHNNSEMPHFHFNESLFKPYETLILLELCDADIQDQVVASIHQFVEGSASEIRSGWRPLFGALRSIKMTKLESIDTSHIRAILDVFEAFLSTESPVIFSHAALDCIMCLLKHIKSTKEIKKCSQEFEEVVEISQLLSDSAPCFHDAALGYIVRCHSILAKLYLLPTCPMFKGAEKIQTGSQPIHVTTVIPGKEVINFDQTTVTLEDFPFSLERLNLSYDDSRNILENSGLLKIWFLMIDGLVSAFSSCEVQKQSPTINTFFLIMKSLMPEPYEEFGLFCVNHLLLPGIQTWLRNAGTSYRGWTRSSQGLKQTVGMTTDLILDWVTSHSSTNETMTKSTELMLKQLVITLVECTVVNHDTISRLGCSCLKHIIAEGFEKLSTSQWDLIINGVVKASVMTLYPAHQLMASFMVGSENFYGDIGTVRVAARRDSTLVESSRIRQLCYQILLLDNQIEEIPKISGNLDIEDRSYLFLLQPFEKDQKELKEDTVTVRVTLSEFVTGLTAQNMLLQMIGLMLSNERRNLLTNTHLNEKSDSEIKNLNNEQIYMLLTALKHSFDASNSFDKRPGLKFLLQKVAQIPHAANLYKQAVEAWKTYSLTLLELCLKAIKNKKFSVEDVKLNLNEHTKRKHTLLRKKIKISENMETDYDKLWFGLLHDAFLELCEEYVNFCTYIDKNKEKTSVMTKQSLSIFHNQPDCIKKLLNKLDVDLEPMEIVSKSADGGNEFGTQIHNLELKADLSIEEENFKIQVAEQIISLNTSNYEKHVFKNNHGKENEEATSVKIDEIQQEDYEKEAKFEESENTVGNTKKNDLNEDGIFADNYYSNNEKSEYDDTIEFTTGNTEKKVPNEDDINAGNNQMNNEKSGSDDSDDDLERAKSSISLFECKMKKAKENKMIEYKSKPDKFLAKTKSDEDFMKIKKTSVNQNKDKMSFVSSNQKNTRKNPFIQKHQTSLSRLHVDPDIDKQRANSVKRDLEVHLRIWNELACFFLQLLVDLKDNDLKIILPAIFPGIQMLTATADDFQMKKQLAEFFKKVAKIFGFAGEK